MEYLDLCITPIDHVIADASYRGSGRAWHIAIYLNKSRRKKGISQCYLNLPLPLAAAIDITPGKIVEWKVDTATNSGWSANGPKPKKTKMIPGRRRREGRKR